MQQARVFYASFVQEARGNGRYYTIVCRGFRPMLRLFWQVCRRPVPDKQGASRRHYPADHSDR